MTEVNGYHAHVYFNASSRPVAERLREAIISRFAVKPGGFSDEPRGPHPISQFNVIFKATEFQALLPWLMLNRDRLDVLVHPMTEDMVDDHNAYALWMGTPVPMDLAFLRGRVYGGALLPGAARSS